jgi:hypothetical protein
VVTVRWASSTACVGVGGVAFLGEATGEQTGDGGEGEDDRRDDEQRQPQGKRLGKARSDRGEGEADAVDGQDRRAHTEPAGDPEGRRLLLPLELRQLQVQLDERLEVLLDCLRLGHEAEHADDTTPH